MAMQNHGSCSRCKFGWIDRWMDGYMDGWLIGWIGKWTINRSMATRMDGWQMHGIDDTLELVFYIRNCKYNMLPLVRPLSPPKRSLNTHETSLFLRKTEVRSRTHWDAGAFLGSKSPLWAPGAREIVASHTISNIDG